MPLRNSGLGGHDFAFGLKGLEIDDHVSLPMAVSGMLAVAMAIVGSAMISLCWGGGKTKRKEKSSVDQPEVELNLPQQSPCRMDSRGSRLSRHNNMDMDANMIMDSNMTNGPTSRMTHGLNSFNTANTMTGMNDYNDAQDYMDYSYVDQGQQGQNTHLSMALYKRQPDCPETNSVFQNEEPKTPQEAAQLDPNFKYRGSVENLNEDADVERIRRNRERGNIDYKYRNLGQVEDLGNIQPKTAYEDDGSNQALFDIVMVRLSLINEDFVHRSRYISGQPFGFTHDVLVVNDDDKWVDEEADSYASGKRQRQGNM